MERGVIKSVLAEELKNSLQMKKAYEKELKELPEGSLSEKKINGHKYYYLAKRQGKKVKFLYKGKLSEAEKKHYVQIKQKRSKKKKLLSQVKKQIRYLKGVLRGKEAI